MTPVWQASIGEEAHLPSPASQNGTAKHYVECGPLSETAALGTGKPAAFTAEEPEELVTTEEDYGGD